VPIYEYRCDACDHRLEAIQKISDAPLKTCPECGTDALRKLISAAAFVLKGTGWYVTDFRDKDKPKIRAGNGKGKETGRDGERKSGGEAKAAQAAGETKPDETAKPGAGGNGKIKTATSD
jgi:putative FmdB family regulatory protein